jgi:hypothetical protein
VTVIVSFLACLSPKPIKSAHSTTLAPYKRSTTSVSRALASLREPLLGLCSLCSDLNSTPCKGACGAIRQPGGLLQLHDASTQHYAHVCHATACTHGVLTATGCMALHMCIQTGMGAEDHR